MKIQIAVIGAVLLLTLTGCAGAATTTPTSPADTSRSTVTTDSSEPAELDAPQLVAGPIGAGDVCDPGNANDVICAAFYPDQAVLNIAARNESLASLGEDVVVLAHLECDALRGEGESSGDAALISAATLAYCPEFYQGSGTYPDLATRRLAYYQGIGEDAARAEFSDGTMPTLEQLGY